MALSLINSGGGAYNAPTSGGGISASGIFNIAQKLPVIGSIASSLASVGGVIGIKPAQFSSPATLIAQRIAAAQPILLAAQAGDLRALDELWVRSGRPLPRVKGPPPPADPRVYTAAGLQNIGGVMTGAWPRVGDQLMSAYQEIVAMLGEQAWPNGSVGTAINNMTLGPKPPGVTNMGLNLFTPAIGGASQDSPALNNAAGSSTNYAVIGILILGALYLMKGR